MKDKFEIEIHPDNVLVFSENWTGTSVSLAAEFNPEMTLEELAQEVYELLAAAGMEVKFVEGI